ncbi:MAG: TolC family protein [Mucilaginibacter sp.]
MAFSGKYVISEANNFALHKNMHRSIVVILSGLLFVGNIIPAFSQTDSPANDTLFISLSDAWNKAEAHSRLIEIKKKSTGIADEEVKDAKMDRYPELGVMGSAEEASNMPIYQNGIFSQPIEHEIIHNLYHVGGDFYLNIYNGNKTNLKIVEDKTLHQLSKIQQDQAISDIHYKTAALYLDLQKSLIFRNLVIQDIADQEKQLAEIKAFHKNGTVLKSDVLRVELDLSKRKMALITIENDILITTQKLNIIMGEPDERIIHPTEISSHWDEQTSYEQYLAEAFQHSFPYHISEQQTVLSKIHLKQVKANLSPKVGMYGEYYYADPQIFLYPYNPYWYSLGVAGIKVSFPISELYHNIHKERAARLEVEREEESHRDTEDQMRQQVKEAYLRYKEAIDQIKVSEVNLARAEENARIIRNTYFNQTSLITDLLDADVQVLQTRFELATARIIAQNKFYLLQNITGVL